MSGNRHMAVGAQLPLWIPCVVCGRPMMLDPAMAEFYEPFHAAAWEEHRPCTWAQLRWSGIPADFVSRVRRMTS